MNNKVILLSAIQPATYNPRIITKDEFAGLKNSLQAFGQQENLIVNKDMTLISGHQRMRAMLSLGWTEAVCNVVDLDKHEEKKLNVIMNSQAISGTWDDLKLSEILEELKLDDNYIDLRLNALEPLDLSDIERVEDPEIKFTEVLGESHNYVVLYFDNDIDWLQLNSLYELSSVKALNSKDGYEKIGIGRVVRGSDFIKKIKNEN